jgi:hypothetical protein
MHELAARKISNGDRSILCISFGCTVCLHIAISYVASIASIKWKYTRASIERVERNAPSRLLVVDLPTCKISTIRSSKRERLEAVFDESGSYRVT